MPASIKGETLNEREREGAAREEDERVASGGRSFTPAGAMTSSPERPTSASKSRPGCICNASIECITFPTNGDLEEYMGKDYFDRIQGDKSTRGHIFC